MIRGLPSSVVAFVLFASAPLASAATISVSHFSGTGQAGSLATGSDEPWFINCAGTGPSGAPCPAGDFAWGSPGVGQGVTAYVGETPAEDFEITFPDFLIDPGPLAIGNASACAGREAGGTTFCTEDSSKLVTMWSAVFDAAHPHSIAFFAPLGTDLDNTESYFVNIFLVNPDSSGALPQSAPFSGDWTAEAVPEPTTLVLFGSGLLAAALRRRKLLLRG